MATFRISKELATVIPHPNADTLDLVFAGDRQFIFKKDVIQSGDLVIIVPEKAMLPDKLAEPFKQYLAPNNRVRANALRGESSEGVLLTIDTVVEYLKESPEKVEKILFASLGEDIRDVLDITEYDPFTVHLANPYCKINLYGDVERMILPYHSHDCEQFRVFERDFDPEEIVLVHEKVHGSLISVTFQLSLNISEDTDESRSEYLSKLHDIDFQPLKVDAVAITSKGRGKYFMQLKDIEGNFYWNAYRNSGLEELVTNSRYLMPIHTYTDYSESYLLQIICEAIPCQANFNYGQKTPTLRVFKVVRNGTILNNTTAKKLLNGIEDLWVPLVWSGKFKDMDIHYLANKADDGMSLIDSSTIREGLVVSPLIPRNSHKASDLCLKYLSEKYQKLATGEELN